MVGIMLLCMGGFVLSVLEGRELGSFVGSFYGTGDDMGGHFIGLGVGGIVTALEIDAMQFKYSSPVYCKPQM